MIYIDNLCEFICQLICSGEGGVFFPQNTEYVNTTELIKEIGQVKGRHIYTTAVLAPFVHLACKVPGKIGRMVNKAFGSMVYDAGLSKYDGMDYQLIGFKESLQWLRQSDQ